VAGREAQLDRGPDSRTRSKRALRRPHCPHVSHPRPSAASRIVSSARASGARHSASPPWARRAPADDLSCSHYPAMCSVTEIQGHSSWAERKSVWTRLNRRTTLTGLRNQAKILIDSWDFSLFKHSRFTRFNQTDLTFYFLIIFYDDWQSPGKKFIFITCI